MQVSFFLLENNKAYLLKIYFIMQSIFNIYKKKLKKKIRNPFMIIILKLSIIAKNHKSILSIAKKKKTFKNTKLNCVPKVFAM